MKTIKMSLANLQGKMNRKEMRNIMAGSGNGGDACDRPGFPCNAACWTSSVNSGTCKIKSGKCTCVSV